MRKKAQDEGIDCLILVPGVNLFYLSGLQMGLSERITLIGVPADSEPFAVCPQFETERITSDTNIRNIFSYKDDEGPSFALQSALQKKRGQVFGIEFRYARLLEWDLIKQCLGELEIKNIDSILANQRSIKDPEELGIMERSAQIADTAAKAGLKAVQPGISEVHVAGVVERTIKKNGGEGYALVASGKRSAVPHAQATDKIIEDGETVWIDIVVCYDNYMADITRSCFAGKPDAEFMKIYRIVLEAQEKGRTMAKPGMTGAEIDALCRDYITEAGYGESFTHRTGHGIGLEVHEEPYIMKSNHKKLEPNMTFTIEPGIYLSGKGGVRIEDDVVLTKDSVRSLTKLNRSLV